MITEYYKPESVGEALELKKKLGAEAAFLAGGTELNRLQSSVKANALIDLEKLSLKKVELEGSKLLLGAALTLQELLDRPKVPETIKKAARQAGSRPIRHMATLGGNIASDRRDSYLVPALLAYEAKVEVAGAGEMALSDWLEKKEGLILSVILPEPDRCVRLARVTRTVQGPPVLVAAYSCASGSNKARLVVGGLPGPARHLSNVEDAWAKGSAKDADSLEKLVSELVSPVSDYLGSAEYKRYIAGVTAADLFSACSC